MAESASSLQNFAAWGTLLTVIIMIVGWCACAAGHVIGSKWLLNNVKVLTPMHLCLGELLVGALLTLVWMAASYRFKSLAGDQLSLAVFRKAFVSQPKLSVILSTLHLMGGYCTLVAMSGLSVSFLQGLKASEPLMAAMFSWICLRSLNNDAPEKNSHNPLLNTGKWLCLFGITSGLVLATVAEVSLNLHSMSIGFGASASMQLRNVLSKKFTLQSYSLNAFLTLGALAILPIASSLVVMVQDFVSFSLSMLPYVYLNHPITDGGLAAAQISSLDADRTVIDLHASLSLLTFDILSKIMVVGALYFVYNALSCMVLKHMTPTSHSVIKTSQRLIIWATSVVFLPSNTTWQSIVGLSVALLSAAGYSVFSVKLSHNTRQRASSLSNGQEQSPWGAEPASSDDQSMPSEDKGYVKVPASTWIPIGASNLRI